MLNNVESVLDQKIEFDTNVEVTDVVPESEEISNDNLDDLIEGLTTKFGEGAAMLLGKNTADFTVKSIPTGAVALDVALGIGGIPRGRITEIFGPESSGKTTLAQHIVASAQKMGGNAAYIDMEHAIEPQYAAQIGVDIDKLLIAQPNNGEEALELCDYLVRSNRIDVIILDSVAALVPRAELAGEMGQTQMSGLARLMAHAMRKLVGVTARTKTALVFINQVRDIPAVAFGPKETTPGGRALKFGASVRIDIRRIKTMKENNVGMGLRCRTRIIKNKVAPPFRDAEFELMFTDEEHGISRMGNLLEFGTIPHPDSGEQVIQRRGAYYYYGEEKIGQGLDNAKSYLRINPGLADEIETKIRSLYGLTYDGLAGHDERQRIEKK